MFVIENVCYYNYIIIKHHSYILLMKVPTSIKVDGDLWHKFKLHCVEHKINMSDVLEKLIKKYLGAKK